jgi:hypothetical protein
LFGAGQSRTGTDVHAKLRSFYKQINIRAFKCGPLRDVQKACDTPVGDKMYKGQFMAVVRTDHGLKDVWVMVTDPAWMGPNRLPQTNPKVLAFAGASVLAIAAQDMPASEHFAFAQKVIESGEAGVIRGDWRFASSLFSFAA